MLNKRDGHKIVKFILAKTSLYKDVYVTENGQWEPLRSGRTAGTTIFDILCVIGFECLTAFSNGMEALRLAAHCWE